ncbi:MAG: hydroxyisourate hydrolase [Gemmatimonadota bacterium]|nr:hydroxyisourate hydrolase [Gemmatimonadota bacterium]
MGISTHVLDTARGRPGGGVPVTLEHRSSDEGWSIVALATTDEDGRVPDLVADGEVEPGLYRLGFDTEAYFAERGERSFFPWVSIAFDVADGGEHYHVPLLMSSFGYTTYRGS